MGDIKLEPDKSRKGSKGGRFFSRLRNWLCPTRTSGQGQGTAKSPQPEAERNQSTGTGGRREAPNTRLGPRESTAAAATALIAIGRLARNEGNKRDRMEDGAMPPGPLLEKDGDGVPIPVPEDEIPAGVDCNCNEVGCNCKELRNDDQEHCVPMIPKCNCKVNCNCKGVQTTAMNFCIAGDDDTICVEVDYDEILECMRETFVEFINDRHAPCQDAPAFVDCYAVEPLNAFYPSLSCVLKSYRMRTNTPAHLIAKSYDTLNNLRHLNVFAFISSQRHLQNQLNQINHVTLNPPKLPLWGIPVGVKDNFCVKGLPATCSSKMLQDFTPLYTATVVQKLIDAGAIVVGKTNMDEFGMGCGTLDSIFGPTKNVWGLEEFRVGSPAIPSFSDWRIPGGSSGGSAVAVASGICFAALGSDTGGSTRNPASYCGVVGLKPTYGLLSRHGLIPLVNSLDTPGIITRTVEDAALIFNVIKGFDELDSTSYEEETANVEIASDFKLEGLRVGIPDEFACPGMDAEVIQCWKEVGDLLAKNGAFVSRVSLPHTKYSIACYSVLNPCEVASNMARYDGLRYGHRTPRPKVNSTEGLYAQTRHEGFNDVVRGRILAGNYFLLKANYDKYFTQALKVRRLITQDFERVWRQDTDVLLTPVTLSAPPTYSDFARLDSRTQTSLQDYCTQSANMAGVPALSLPIKLNSSGLPLSLQLIGPKLSEGKLLNVAKWIENVVQFPHFVLREGQ